MNRPAARHPIFKTGDNVSTAHNRAPGQIIDGPNKKGEYLVSLGSLTFWAHESKLEPAAAKKKRKANPRPAGQDARGSAAVVSVDLHALTREQAISRLEETIDRALVSGTGRIEVIHGIGTGAVKRAVLEYLAASRHISSFAADERNAGTTLVYL